jgi:hypothetical protein
MTRTFPLYHIPVICFLNYRLMGITSCIFVLFDVKLALVGALVKLSHIRILLILSCTL